MIEKETALKFLAAGLAVLPADKTLKRPVMAWKNYQEYRPVNADVERWFSDRHNAICLICGKFSGNLEVIDFDQHGELYPAWEAQISAELKSELKSKLNEFSSPTDTMEETFENREQIEISKYYERIPKPVLIATEEFLDGEVVFEEKQ